MLNSFNVVESSFLLDFRVTQRGKGVTYKSNKSSFVYAMLFLEKEI